MQAWLAVRQGYCGVALHKMEILACRLAFSDLSCYLKWAKVHYRAQKVAENVLKGVLSIVWQAVKALLLALVPHGIGLTATQCADVMQTVRHGIFIQILALPLSPIKYYK